MFVSLYGHHCGQVDIEKILKEIDTDKDGLINYNEFCTCVRKMDEVGGWVGLMLVQQ